MSNWKTSCLLPIFLLTLFSDCKRSDGDGNSFDDPIGSLQVEETSFITITNTFGPNDPASGAAAALFQLYKDYLPERIFLLNIPSQNSPVFNPGVTDSIVNTFFKKPPVPALHLNNEFVDVDLTDEIDIVSKRPAKVGVNHLVTDKGDFYEVRAKVKFFDFFSSTSFYITSYLLGDFETRDYGGGINFSTPPFPGVTELLSGKLAFSTDGQSLRDTTRLVFKKGDQVIHYRVLLATDSVAFAPGLLLDTINIFGRSYDAGDIFGLKQTPLIIKLPKTPSSEVAGSLYVATFIFKKEDGDEFFKLENTFQTKIK